jgi:hypothetical protein
VEGVPSSPAWRLAKTAGGGEKAATDKKTDAAAGVGVVRTGEIVANRFLLSSY